VLKPGGKFIIVETSQPENRTIRKLFHTYLRYFVYPVGRMISGNSGAYRYLSESAARYYSAGELKDMLLAAGFGKVFFRRLFFGAAAIHVAVKRES
jgi:demethylmenaquinone methyltransferase/2-methoxy-6-polyprenyl-1,4-benzoquinol methylase